MLIGILTDNPGPSFTKNFDKKFVEVVKNLLRNGQDPSVQQILRETLDRLEVDKAYDRNLEPIFAMWRKEKGIGASFAGGRPVPRNLNAPPWNSNGAPMAPSAQTFGAGASFSRSHSHHRGLPPPAELAGRVEEARTSAKLLQQLIQSTPAEEMLANELIKEFSERCESAQRSVQGYINCDNPAPDHDTLQTLIETNEQLALATSKYQRAVLQARRLAPSAPTTPTPPPQGNTAPTLPPIDTSDPTDVSYAAPTRRPTQPTPPNLNSVQDDSTFAAPSGPPPSRKLLNSNTLSLPKNPLSRSKNKNKTKPSTTPPPAAAAAAELPVPDDPNAGAAADPFSDDHASPHPLEPVNYGPPTSASPTQPPRLGAEPPSQSYVLRQESAANGISMHGAARPGPESDVEADDEGTDGEQAGRRRSAGMEMGGGAQSLGGGAAGVRDDSTVSSVSPVETRAPTFRY
jgi:hypothetical protein